MFRMRVAMRPSCFTQHRLESSHYTSDMFDGFRRTTLSAPVGTMTRSSINSKIAKKKSMNSDEIVIQLGLVSEKTLGSTGTYCEGINPAIPEEPQNSGYPCG